MFSGPCLAACAFRACFRIPPDAQPIIAGRPRVIYLTRTDSGTGTRVVYVTIAHSSGGAYGAESDATPFTYADSVGAGGDSGGDGDPFGGGKYGDS